MEVTYHGSSSNDFDTDVIRGARRSRQQKQPESFRSISVRIYKVVELKSNVENPFIVVNMHEMTSTSKPRPGKGTSWQFNLMFHMPYSHDTRSKQDFLSVELWEAPRKKSNNFVGKWKVDVTNPEIRKRCGCSSTAILHHAGREVGLIEVEIRLSRVPIKASTVAPMAQKSSQQQGSSQVDEDEDFDADILTQSLITEKHVSGAQQPRLTLPSLVLNGSGTGTPPNDKQTGQKSKHRRKVAFSRRTQSEPYDSPRKNGEKSTGDAKGSKRAGTIPSKKNGYLTVELLMKHRRKASGGHSRKPSVDSMSAVSGVQKLKKKIFNRVRTRSASMRSLGTAAEKSGITSRSNSSCARE